MAMNYSSTLSAVVSALAAECIDNTSKQAWQRRIGESEGRPGNGPSGVDRVELDCWVHGRLHSQLIPRHWHVLVAKYSTHKGRKVEAISALRAVVATPAPALFLYKAVTAWAIPKLKGVKAEAAKTVTVEVPVRASAGKQAKIVAAAVEAARVKAKREEARSGGAIVLPAAFYDMNTWDPDASPESTRREWRRNIGKVLDEMVAEAMQEAERILLAEGVLLSDAA